MFDYKIKDCKKKLLEEMKTWKGYRGSFDSKVQSCIVTDQRHMITSEIHNISMVIELTNGDKILGLLNRYSRWVDNSEIAFLPDYFDISSENSEDKSDIPDIIIFFHTNSHFKNENATCDSNLLEFMWFAHSTKPVFKKVE